MCHVCGETQPVRTKTSEETAREYYNSDDADAFYSMIWGGEDIHIGIYESPRDSISAASRRTVEYIASRLNKPGEATRVLDIGSGYAGVARFLARTYGCHVSALNLSDVENEAARRLNKEQGLDEQIEVIDGSFQEIRHPDDTFDAVWSQDALLHSGDRKQVVEEVARVLKPDGQFVFTDPMQADDCPEGVLRPILDRIHLESLGSLGFYCETATQAGLAKVAFDDLTAHLVTHYARVLEETENRADELDGAVSPAYTERMKKGLRHWIEGGRNGYLAWGIFEFRAA
jgi:sarcosine/dimethylglycine N-methyltransferase